MSKVSIIWLSMVLLFSIKTQISIAQVDKNKIQLPSKIYTAETMVGDWVSSNKDKVTIKESEPGILSIRKKGSDWLELTRAGHNLHRAEKEGRIQFQVRITGDHVMEFTDYSNSESEVKSIYKRKVDGVVIGDESSVQSISLEEKKMFVSFYPSLHSPFAVYVGRLNKKYNYYGGISISAVELSGDFSEGYSDGEIYESLSGDPDNEGISTGDEVVGQMTIAIGLSSEVVKNKLRVHYGVGFGKYEVYRGFDIWRRNSDGDWKYDKSVWARDDQSIVEGVYLEAGLLWDIGVLISVGFGTISFEQSDIRVGIGHAF